MADSRLSYSEFMKTFLDLPKMFSHIKKLNRGELYKLLPFIVKNYNNDWNSTMDNNNYNDIRRFVNLLKVYGVKHDIPRIDKFERNRKFFAHMFTTLSKTRAIPEKVDATIEKVDDLVDKMHLILDSSSEDIKKMFSNLNTFTSLFVPASSHWTDIISYITKFAAFGYLLSQEHNRSLPNVLALLTLILPTGVGDCIISSLKRAIQGIWEKFSKVNELVAMSYDDDNTIVSFFKVTVHLVKSMFTTIPFEHFKNMQLSVAKIKMVADYLKNSSTIFEYIMKLFQKTLEIVGNKLLKYYGKLPKLLQQENLNDLIDRYVKIKEERLDVKAVNNSYVARQVMEVYTEALNAQAKLVKSNKKIDFGQSKLLAYLNIMIRNLEQVVAKIPDHVKGTKNARRTKPFWIYIYGEPRIGKTSMFQPYIVNAVARCCGLIDKYRDYSEYTYFRNCGDEYWEKYCGQPVLWYNDLFQVFTNEQKVNIGIEEITNVVDDNLYPLNMAFEEKHNVYFDSQLVISNAQDDIVGKSFVTNKCLSSGTHIFSRRNIVVRLRVDSKYKSANGLNYAAISAAKDAGAPFIGDLFPKDMYQVDFMDPVSGMYLKTLDFAESIKAIITGYQAYKDHQDNFKERLFNHFETMWAQGSDSWEDAIYQAASHTWQCQQCESIYNESTMLLEHERDEIRTILLLNCPHKVVEEKRRWVEFGEMIKINVQALWSTVRDFIKNNVVYIMLSAVVALIPLVFMVVQNYFKDKYYALSAETNIKRPKQVVRLQAQEYSQQNKDVENKIMRNMAMVFIRLNYKGEDKRLILGSCLGVGGDIFVMPRHFYDRITDFAKYYGNDSVRVELSFLGNQVYEMVYQDIKDLGVNFQHLTDIVFLQFPKLCCLSKLDRFFVTTRDEPVLYDSYLFGRRVDNYSIVQTLPVCNVALTSRDYVHPSMELPILGKFIPEKKIILPEGYEFRTNGVCVGDCGMILINCDDKLNARKLMGIHVAGSQKGGIGLASTIYQEDIQSAYEKAGMFITMESMDFMPIDQSNSVLKYNLMEMFNVCGVLFQDDKKIKLSIPMKSSIQKSVFFDLIYDDFGPNTCIPARLRPFTIDDVRYSPMLLGLRKMCKVNKSIPSRIVGTIKNHMYSSIMSWQSKYSSEPRVLTLFEAVNGLDNLNKIDITTSAGFPYQLSTKKGGKRDWFEIIDDKLYPNQYLEEQILERENLARKGIIKATFFVDTLKDELRPIDKVNKGKTRVFQVGPMCLSILMRKYFGFFIMHCQTTFINGEMGIGINPNSLDWTMLIKRLLRTGNKFINGDYSDYDASMSQPIMMDICGIINKFYGTDKAHEHSIIRNTLFATFLNNVHIVEDVVFMRLQGNMSGIALTTIVNCLFNMFLSRYAYYKLIDDDLTLFHSRLSCTFYGDDNLISVSDDIIDKYNMNTYCDVMRQIGITYTTPDKTDMSVPFYNVDQITYLKRKFVKRANIYYACLEWSTILEIPRWSESDPNNMLDQLNRFNCVLYESVNYGLEEYKTFYKKFFEYILLANKKGYVISTNQLLSYAYILRSMFPQYFTSDLTYQLDQAYNMLSESGSFKSENIRSNCSSDGSSVNFYKTTMENNNNNELQVQSAEGSVQRAQVQITRQMVAQNYDLRDLMDDIQYPINFNNEFKFHAMSNDKWDNTAMAMDENAGETIEQSQITTTYDDTIPHITSDGAILDPFAKNPYLPLSLESFVNREWYLAKFDWTSDLARTSIVKSITLPNKFLDLLGNKVANIAYWAPDFELTFRVNGTPMHYGRIMFAVVPQADILHSSYLQPQNFSQHRFVQLSPTGNQTVKLKVPWLHFYDRMPCTAKGPNMSTNPWTLYAWVAAPLLSAVSDTVAPVSVAVYGKILKPRFVGYINTNLATVEEEPLMAQSSEQQILSTRENVATQPKSVGLLSIPSTIARKIEKVAGDMSQLALDAGFSNCPNLTATKPVIYRNMTIARAEDLPTTLMLGPSQSQYVEVNNAQANAQQDGMRIAKIAGRMALLRTVKITSSTEVGSSVATIVLNPNTFVYQDYELTDAKNTHFPLPAMYMARMFRFWRGGFKVHVSFICSAFHSMRMRMNYQPFVGSNNLTVPNESTSAYNVNQVWDINNQTDYSFNIPHLYWADWTPQFDTWNAGTLYFTPLTKLTSTTATPQPIYMQIWIAMDDDFQLAYPILRKAGDAISNNPVTYFSNPDIGKYTADLVAQSNNNFEKVLNAGNPMLNYRSMQFPCMSSDGLEAIKYPLLGGEKDDKHKAVRTLTSFEVASVKEICNMITPIERQIVTFKGTQSTSDQILQAGRTLIPYAWMDKGANDPIWFCYLYQIMAIFRYARGSVRLAAQSNRCYQATAVLGDTRFKGDTTSIWEDYKDDIFFGDASMSGITSGGHLFNNVTSEPIDITIPYYSNVKCLPQTYGVTTDGKYPGIGFNPIQPDAAILCNFIVPANTPTNTEVGRILWLVSGGDDFQLGYQLPVPRCRYGVV
ncbi:hypothetical protein [Wenzhou picorna-like virus 39]|uniref:hypothetical protein n=1 Tax=Wenzhou picorna-like virus 39 TaxID=1923625 RepID=UPI0009095BAE|nr:hypothetical protein [Wenzhou picorna-like virus 39]APG78508.1 hypothetical protein [Wenzhou picorna-like virus 39]